MPITVETSVGKFALAQYNEANSLKKIADAKLLQKKLDAGTVSLEKFSRAVAETPPAFYVNLVEDLTASIAEFAKLSEDVDKRCDGHGPPKSNIQTALTAYLDVVKEVAREKLKVAAAVPTPTPGTKEDGAPAAGDQAAKPAPAGVLQNREQALESLQKVADFYRRTEPHSPVSYALDQVVRWGRMPLPELWTELIAEEAPREFVQTGGHQTARGRQAAAKEITILLCASVSLWFNFLPQRHRGTEKRKQMKGRKHVIGQYSRQTGAGPQTPRPHQIRGRNRRRHG